MSHRVRNGLAVLVVSAALVTSSVATLFAQRQAATVDRTPTQVLEGSYRVSVDLGAGESRLDRILRIEFHQEYVILIDVNDSGRVVPVQAIKQLTFDRT